MKKILLLIIISYVYYIYISEKKNIMMLCINSINFQIKIGNSDNFGKLGISNGLISCNCKYELNSLSSANDIENSINKFEESINNNILFHKNIFCFSDKNIKLNCKHG